MKNIFNRLRVFIAISFVIFVVTGLIDHPEKDRQKEVPYPQLISLINRDKVSKILISKEGRYSVFTLKDDERMLMSAQIDTKENLYNLLLEKRIDITGEKTNKKCKYNVPKLSKIFFSYGRFIDLLEKKQINQVDIVCQNYLVVNLIDQMDGSDNFRVELPNLKGVYPDLINQLISNNVEHNIFE